MRLSGLPELTGYLAQLDAWMRGVETKLALAYGMSSFLSGTSGAGPQSTLSIPHVDSWLFEDNVDGTHPANMRYVIPSPTQRIASARLSIHLAPYRTYNSLSLTSTGATTPATDASGESGHSHSHAHTIPIAQSGAASANVNWNGPGTSLTTINNNTGGNTSAINSDATGSSGHSHSHNHGSHTHTVSGTSTLGVTEGATASGVTIQFINGKTGGTVDATVALGGPFNADVVELDVTRYLPQDKGVWHTVAMQPSGLGRIEAHLRLSVFVNAAAGF